MKTILVFCIASLSLFMFNCRAQESTDNPTSVSSTEPFDFSWIKQSEEIKLATGNIYFYGKSEGKYVDNEKWLGKITGDIFLQPKACKFLSHELYLQGFTIQVNEDSSINIIAPEQAPFINSKKVIF